MPTYRQNHVRFKTKHKQFKENYSVNKLEILSCKISKIFQLKLINTYD